MKTVIRTTVMNLTLSQWEKIRDIVENGAVTMTPKELMDFRY